MAEKKKKKPITSKKQRKFIGGKEVSKKDYQAIKAGLGFKGGSGGVVSEEAKKIIGEEKAKDVKLAEKKKEKVEEATKGKPTQEKPQAAVGEEVTAEPTQEVEPTIQKAREVGKEDIEYETLIQTDVYGIQKEIQVPKGTGAKINAGLQERIEGRKPFGELPTYQQFLAEAAVLGVSPQLTVGVGRPMGKMVTEFGKLIKSTLGKYISGAVTMSGIITWLASDNIIGSMSIYGRDLAEDVQWGRLSKEEGIKKFDEGMEFVEQGRSFIRTATILNPLLWPFRKIILINADAAELSLEENRNRILRAK